MGFQLVDDLVLRRLQVTDCKGSRHGRKDADHRSYGSSHEQAFGSRREAFVRLLSHEGLLRLRGKATHSSIGCWESGGGEAGHKVLNRPSGHSANLNWLEFGTYPNHQRSPLLMMATGMNVAASRSVSSLRPPGKMIGSTNRADHGT